MTPRSIVFANNTALMVGYRRVRRPRKNCSDEKNNGKPIQAEATHRFKHSMEANYPWTSTPRLLAELKKAVILMRDEREIRLLRFAELTQRLEQALPDEKLQESDVRTAVKLLANHGLARQFEVWRSCLVATGTLEWLRRARSSALPGQTRTRSAPCSRPIFTIPASTYTGVDRLKHRPDEELLLRALVQTFLDHSLCIAEDLANGRHLVFPSQYRREKDTPRDPDIFVSYTFSGEWQTVWTTLVVRLWYSEQFKHKELWRNAVEFVVTQQASRSD